MKPRTKKSGWLVGIATLGMLQLACSPYCMRAHCLRIEEASNIKVTKRFDGTMVNGTKIYLAKKDVPIESYIYGNGYAIRFETPVNVVSGHVIIFAQSSTPAPVDLIGPDLHKIGVNPYKINETLFDMNTYDHKSHFIAFLVVDSNGSILGNVKVKYELITVGYALGFDTL